jgi:hypothetical protein
LQALRATVGSAVSSAVGVVSDRGGLAPSVDLGAGTLALPACATAVAGLEAHAPEAAETWLSGMVQWVTGAPHGPLPQPHADLPLRTWAVLHEGAPPGLPVASLQGAIPRGDAWVAALSPNRFVAQAITRLSSQDTPHGRRMAARLRSPSANLSTIHALVETAALSLDLGETPALRLRVGCTDTAAAFQAAVVLQAWRVRRSSGEDAAATAFGRAYVLRGATRVELCFPGTVEQVLGLVVPPSR